MPLAVAALALAACNRSPEGLRFVGTLERDRIEIVAEEAEPILSLEVREGEHVTPGQVLLRQDTGISAARAAQADAQVAHARYRLTELEQGARLETRQEAQARLAAARAALQRDEREFQRLNELVRQKLVSQSLLDEARAARDRSRALVREAEAQVAELKRGTRIEQLEQARAAFAAAESARRELELTQTRLVVQATRAGVVEALPYKVGERPPRGSPIAILLADDTAYARIYVPEPYRVRVRPGTQAAIYVDGFEAEGKPLTGTVRFIAREATFTPYYALTQRDRSRLTFLAEVQIDDPRVKDLPAGVPVEVAMVEKPQDGSPRD